MEKFFKHYIRLDEQGRIIGGFSTAFRLPSDSDICINEKGGYQFRLIAGGAENPVLFGEQGVPLYKYEAGGVVSRAADEIESDRASAVKETASQFDVIEAQTAYTAMKCGTLLKELGAKAKIARWFRLGLWTVDMVHCAAEHGVLKKSEAAEIVAA